MKRHGPRAALPQWERAALPQWRPEQLRAAKWPAEQLRQARARWGTPEA